MKECTVLFILLLLLLLAIYIFDYKQNKDIFKNKKNIIVFIILMCPIFSLFTVTAGSEDMNQSERLVLSSKNNNYSEIKNIAFNKVVIVGDSRMEYIKNNEDELDIPNNFIFDAKSGASMGWTTKSGMPKLKEILENKDENYHYHVLFNLGVNDLQSDVDIEKMAFDYFELYKEVILNNKNVDFYLLSVNPVDEEIIYDHFPENIRTNERIEEFNYYLKRFMLDSGLTNVKYCDSYNNMDFDSPDGLHYDLDTDQDIIDFITNKCIDYK